jgi:hypothetical protein
MRSMSSSFVAPPTIHHVFVPATWEEDGRMRNSSVGANDPRVFVMATIRHRTSAQHQWKGLCMCLQMARSRLSRHKQYAVPSAPSWGTAWHAVHASNAPSCMACTVFMAVPKQAANPSQLLPEIIAVLSCSLPRRWCGVWGTSVSKNMHVVPVGSCPCVRARGNGGVGFPSSAPCSSLWA